TLGAEIRSRDRATAAPAAPSAEQPMAPGRDGGADRREADVPLACRRPRGRGPRPACPAPARQPGGAAAGAQAAQEAQLRTEIAGHRQAALLRRGVPPSAPDLPARARAAQEQSRGELASGRATTRAQAAALQVGSICPPFPQHARRRPQYLQPATPPHLPI